MLRRGRRRSLCPFSSHEEMERRETAGGLRGLPWGNLRSASPAPGRSRTPKDGIASSVLETRPRESRPGANRAERRGGASRRSTPQASLRSLRRQEQRSLSDRRSRSGPAPRHDGGAGQSGMDGRKAEARTVVKNKEGTYAPRRSGITAAAVLNVTEAAFRSTWTTTARCAGTTAPQAPS